MCWSNKSCWIMPSQKTGFRLHYLVGGLEKTALQRINNVPSQWCVCPGIDFWARISDIIKADWFLLFGLQAYLLMQEMVMQSLITQPGTWTNKKALMLPAVGWVWERNVIICKGKRNKQEQKWIVNCAMCPCKGQSSFSLCWDQRKIKVLEPM